MQIYETIIEWEYLLYLSFTKFTRKDVQTSTPFTQFITTRGGKEDGGNSVLFKDVMLARIKMIY